MDLSQWSIRILIIIIVIIIGNAVRQHRIYHHASAVNTFFNWLLVMLSDKKSDFYDSSA